MDAIEALRTRRCCRRYTDQPVAPALLEQIIDAGRLAATARNEQPCDFVVVTSAETRRRIADLSEHGKFIAESPACIAVIAKDTKYYVEDGSAATQNLLLAAHAVGLASCWVAGDKKAYAPQIVELLGAPPTMRLVALVAVGYPRTDLPNPPKRPLEEVIHWERF
jgi:nitroreductase